MKRSLLQSIFKKTHSYYFVIIVLTVVLGGLYFIQINTDVLLTRSEGEFQKSLHANLSTLLDRNYNIGTINVRAIIANIDETGNKFGSYGMRFNETKVGEAEQALQKLNSFVKQSSYDKAQLQWDVTGIYELGSVCDYESYGEKVNNLIYEALIKSDFEKPIPDYSYYFIVHPIPDCADGITWSHQGQGNFKKYELNGRIVNLRGIRVMDLWEAILFHEFGHSLGYVPNTGIGDASFFQCPITSKNNRTYISISPSCRQYFNFYEGPVFTIMSGARTLSDYNIMHKIVAGWIDKYDVVEGKRGHYILSPLEQTDSGIKGLEIPIAGSEYIVHVSFRQPNGFIYPATQNNVPNGVVLDVARSNQLTSSEFLISSSTNINAPLTVGMSYELSTSGPTIKVNSIRNNKAYITVSR